MTAFTYHEHQYQYLPGMKPEFSGWGQVCPKLSDQTDSINLIFADTGALCAFRVE